MVEPERTSNVDDDVRSWRQGDVVDLSSFTLYGSTAPTHEAVEAVVIISQTCEIVRPRSRRSCVEVVPLLTLTGDAASEAASGSQPQYAGLPQLEAGKFADFSKCMSIDKLDLVKLSRRPGVSGDHEVGAFSTAVGRWFSRFPFPDGLTETLRPLWAA